MANWIKKSWTSLGVYMLSHPRTHKAVIAIGVIACFHNLVRVHGGQAHWIYGLIGLMVLAVFAFVLWLRRTIAANQ